MRFAFCEEPKMEVKVIKQNGIEDECEHNLVVELKRLEGTGVMSLPLMEGKDAQSEQGTLTFTYTTKNGKDKEQPNLASTAADRKLG
jgi:hypothetical protein